MLWSALAAPSRSYRRAVAAHNVIVGASARRRAAQSSWIRLAVFVSGNIIKPMVAMPMTAVTYQ